MTQPNMLLKDAALEETKAMPAAASTTVYTDGIDLEVSANGLHMADCELEISAPALTTTMLPDTKTMTYKVQMDNDSAFGSPTDLFPSAIVQTGAGGAGAAAQTKRYRLPTDVERYIRLAATSGADVTNSSAVSMAARLLF